MPNWKKLIVSGSDASLNSLIVANGITGSLFGTASQAISSSYALSASYAPSSLTASYAETASYATQFNVAQGLTASGLNYPTVDGLENQVLETDGNGNLIFDDIHTMLEDIYSGEALTKGDPLYISGSQGAKPIVYKADAANSAKMPVAYIALETIGAGADTRGIILGLIEGIDLTGYPAGTEVYVAAGGGWTSTRPTGSAIVQVLGVVTKEGSGGKGLVLNPGPANLPNLQSGYVWVGDADGVPQAVSTSSIQNVVSSSYATTASYALTASYVLNAVSASYAATASSANNFIVRGNLTGSNALFTGTITAQQLNVQYVTASTEYVTGSTKFGSLLSNTHQFTGSVSITGSLAASLTNVNQSSVVGYDTTTGQLYYQATSSLLVDTASYALTASNVQGGGANYVTLWKTDTSLTSSLLYQDTGSNRIGLNTTVPDYTFDVNGTGRFQNDLRALTKLYLPNMQDVPQDKILAWYDVDGQVSYMSTSSLFVTSGSYAVSSSYALNATTASYTLNSTSASYSLTATSASYAATSSNILGGAQYYVPFFNTNTTVSSSFLYQSGSLLKTRFGGNDVGIKLDFANSLYNFGSLGNGLNMNTQTGVFELGQDAGTGIVGLVVDRYLGLSKLGDPDYIGNFGGVGLVIDEDALYIKSRYFGNDTGLYLDFANNQYKLGDYASINNNTSLIVDDQAELIKTTYSSADVGLYLDFINGAFKLGDYNNGNNGTKLTLDDINSRIDISKDTYITGSLYLSSSLHSAQGASAGIGTTTIASIATGSYKAGFFDYVVSSGGNARAGTVMSVWDGSSVQYTDNSTLDIGSTTAVSMSVALSGANVLLQAAVSADTWDVKTTYRLI